MWNTHTHLWIQWLGKMWWYHSNVDMHKNCSAVCTKWEFSKPLQHFSTSYRIRFLLTYLSLVVGHQVSPRMSCPSSCWRWHCSPPPWEQLPRWPNNRALSCEGFSSQCLNPTQWVQWASKVSFKHARLFSRPHFQVFVFHVYLMNTCMKCASLIITT